jgi:choice-of-anchor B domain-containing protein
MKVYINFIFIFTCLSLLAQTTNFHNTKKYAQITGLPGGDLSNLWGYTAPDGKEYAIVGSKAATNIYDVSNCAGPVLKSSFTDGSNTSWREYKTYKKFAYMVTEAAGEGLEMFDLTNPNSITFTQKAAPADADFFYTGHTLSIDTLNARMYVSGVRQSSSSSSNWLNIYQLSSTNIVPTLLKKIQLNTVPGAPALNLYIHDLYVENNIIYCSQGPDGLCIWDCTDPNNIVFLGQKDDSPGYNHSSWRHPFFPQYFYCAEETAGQPMIIYNVTPGSPSYTIGVTSTFKHPLLSPTFTNNIYHNPHMRGNELYISAYNDGTQIYDLSDPLRPIRAAYYDSYPTNTNYSPSFVGAWGIYPFFNSGCICASDINTGFHTFKTYFPKVEINGNIHLPETGKGIVFKDSANLYKLLSVSNAGLTSITSISLSQVEHRIDSADVELKTLGNSIYLTSPNGTKYALTVSDVGTITTAVVSPSAITNAVSFNGYLIIDNKYKGMIMKSPKGERWKFGVNSSGQFTSHRTAF